MKFVDFLVTIACLMIGAIYVKHLRKQEIIRTLELIDMMDEHK